MTSDPTQQILAAMLRCGGGFLVDIHGRRLVKASRCRLPVQSVASGADQTSAFVAEMTQWASARFLVQVQHGAIVWIERVGRPLEVVSSKV